MLAGLLLVGFFAMLHRRASEDLQQHRRDEVADLARILHGFSRAVSPDAIVDAILGELGRGTGADHVVVVRRRADAPVLDAIMTSLHPGVPPSSAFLPASDLEPALPPDRDRFGRVGRVGVGIAVGPGRSPGAAPAGGPYRWTGSASLAGQPDPRAAAEAVGARIEKRVQRAFGLKRTLAVPLVAHDELLGAIVVSRRRAGPWPDAARRLLEIAAAEASAALARAYSHRDAEARAATDPLTGLPNRRYFEEYVELLGRRRRTDDGLGILMVDVDRFKGVNDRYGHAVGDVVLRAVGRTIAQAIRDIDVPARFGGEEFVVLLRSPSEAIALEVGERIRSAVEQMDLADVGVEQVTVSVGATVGRDSGEPVEDLVRRADQALYRAKRQGRNRVESD